MTVQVPLTRGLVALIDDEDAERVLAHKWFAAPSNSAFYARRCIKGPDGRLRWLRLHNFIMNPPPGMVVDHIDRDTLRNVRSNLRICSVQENVRNRRMHSNNKTGLKGVYREGKLFCATICVNYRSKRIGYYDTAEEAHAAYCRKAQELFGEFWRAA